jgi:hypothetical protein
MVKRIAVVTALAWTLSVVAAWAQEVNHLYLTPMVSTTDALGRTFIYPKYFPSRFGGSVTVTTQSAMRYGFLPYALVYAEGLTPDGAGFLAAQSDVYVFPDDIDQPIADPRLGSFFESLSFPTDWLTPATTYRVFLRTLAGMFQFAQRYQGLSGGHALFEGYTLDTNYRSMPAQQATWFDATLASLGYPAVNGNPKVRSLIKQIGDLWGQQPFFLGTLTF